MPTTTDERTSVFEDILRLFTRDPGMDVDINPETGEVRAKARKPFLDRIAYGGRNARAAQELELRSKLAPIEANLRVNEALKKERGVSEIREGEAKADAERKAKLEAWRIANDESSKRRISELETKHKEYLADVETKQKGRQLEDAEIVKIFGRLLSSMTPEEKGNAIDLLNATTNRKRVDTNAATLGDIARGYENAAVADFLDTEEGRAVARDIYTKGAYLPNIGVNQVAARPSGPMIQGVRTEEIPGKPVFDPKTKKYTGESGETVVRSYPAVNTEVAAAILERIRREKEAAAAAGGTNRASILRTR
jgi:hypothetical protein